MPAPTVVLVHGAFADASSWDGVITELLAADLKVVAPPNPLRGVAPDGAYIAAVADQIEGPLLLVGHSYGGAVITQAGGAVERVVGLVYVAAFAPDEGESLLDINGRYPDVPLGAALRFTTFPVDGAEPGTELSIDPEQFPSAFCADLPAEKAAVMAVAQRPAALDAFATSVTGTPAWKKLPSWFVVASADHAIHPDAERFMAERAGSTTIELDGSHAVAGSQPGAVADHIKLAVTATT